MQGEHGSLGVLAVGSSENAFTAVEDLVVGAVPVLHGLEPAVDLAAEGFFGEVVAGEDGAYDAAEFLHGQVDRVLGAVALHEAA